jgi:hypothetical protein
LVRGGGKGEGGPGEVMIQAAAMGFCNIIYTPSIPVHRACVYLKVVNLTIIIQEYFKI